MKFISVLYGGDRCGRAGCAVVDDPADMNYLGLKSIKMLSAHCM